MKNENLFKQCMVVVLLRHREQTRVRNAKRYIRIRGTDDGLGAYRAMGRKHAKIFRERLMADPVKFAEYKKKVAARNREIYALKRKDPAFVEYHRKRIREYNKTPKGRSIQRATSHRIRRGTVNARIADNVRRRLHEIRKGARKAWKVPQLIGCTMEELCAHLEKQFTPGMTWENYGGNRDNWNIDHIHPLAGFDLRNPDEQLKASHYTNLQPMWKRDNCSKNSLVDGVRLWHKDHERKETIV